MLVAYFDFCSNVPLNNTYKNAVHFTTNEERIAFFQNYIKLTTGSNVQYNFNFKPNPNSLTTSLVISFEGLPSHLRKPLFNTNYIVVHQNFDNETEPPEGYYFVTGVRCVRSNVFEFLLELDVMTTYPYGMAWNTNNKVFVERKHCNRFRPLNPTDMIFDDAYANNGDELDGIFKAQYPVSPVYFEQNKNPYDEDEQISENLTRSEVYELISKYQWEMLITTEAINKNQSVWTFAYRRNFESSSSTYQLISGTSENIEYNETILYNDNGSLNSGVYVYLYPKYNIEIDNTNLENIFTNFETYKPLVFGLNLDGSSYGNITPVTFFKEPQLEAISTSINRMQIPHNFIYSLIGKHFKKGNLTIPTNEVGETRVVSNYIYLDISGEWNEYNKMSFIPTSQENDDEIRVNTLFKNNHRLNVCLQITDIDYKNDKVWTFENDGFSFYDIIRTESLDVNEPKNIVYEPKMFKPPYTRYVMNSLLSTSEGFEINPLVLRFNKCSIISKFTPTPSLSRFSYYIKPIVDWTPYTYLEDLNIGVISTMDYSLPIKIDKYAEYITEKRNFAISGLVTPVVSSLLVSGGGMAVTHGLHQGKTSYASAMGASAAGALIGGASALTSAMNYITTIDNLINAPDSVKNTGNDALSDFGLNIPLQPYIVKYEMTEAQKRQVFDYYYMFGYKVSSFFDMGECFGRQRFNYIKTLDDELYEKITTNDSLSNEIRVKIQDIFNKGVTMWEPIYAVDMSIEYENLEK